MERFCYYSNLYQSAEKKSIDVHVPADTLLIDVPPKATAGESGTGQIAVVGYADGVQVISTKILYGLYEHAPIEGSTQTEPTPSLLQQVLTATGNAASAAVESEQAAGTSELKAAESADAAAESAQAALESKTAAEKASENAAASAKNAASAAKKAADESVAANIATLKKIQSDVTEKQNNAAASANAAAKSEENAKQSAETLAGTVENVAANTAAVAELREKKAEIDDTAVGADGWSSTHIIDILCPKIEESGNPVVCYPVAGYPLGVTASWNPMQEGSGPPGPENIRPIKGRNSVTVERCGANLCNPKKVEHFTYNPYGLTIQYVEDNRIHLHGTYTYSSDGSFVIMNTDQPLLAGRGLKIYGFLVDGKAKAFSLYGLRTASETVIAMNTNGWKPGDAVEMTISIVITNGTTAPTAYTPYIGQTNALTLPETVYGGEVDAVSGEGQETWKLVTLDGTENWEKYGNVSEESVTSCFTTIISDKDIGYGTSVCNKFANTKNSDPFNSAQMKKFTYTDHPSLKNIYMNYGDTKTVSSDEWKAYLAAQYAAGTPVQVCYKLATPVPFTATGGAALPALDGANTVITDADSVDVTGRADPIKRIADLETAVASIE